jgi:hypothetical protein
MKTYFNKETNESKTLYTGKEIIIALGRKYQEMSEVLKKYYNDDMDIFDETNNIAKQPLFTNEKEFRYYLAVGNNDLAEAQVINKYDLRDENGKKIKINHYNDLVNLKKNVYVKFISGLLSFIKFLSITLVSGVVVYLLFKFIG